MSSKTSKPLAGIGDPDEEDGSSTVTIFSQDTHETIDTLVSTEYTAAEEESMSIFFSLNEYYTFPSYKRFNIFWLNNLIFNQLQLLSKKKSERNSRKRRLRKMRCLNSGINAEPQSMAASGNS